VLFRKHVLPKFTNPQHPSPPPLMLLLLLPLELELLSVYPPTVLLLEKGEPPAPRAAFSRDLTDDMDGGGNGAASTAATSMSSSKKLGSLSAGGDRAAAVLLGPLLLLTPPAGGAPLPVPLPCSRLPSWPIVLRRGVSMVAARFPLADGAALLRPDNEDCE
jgi:hypothetical protein